MSIGQFLKYILISDLCRHAGPIVPMFLSQLCASQNTVSILLPPVQHPRAELIEHMAEIRPRSYNLNGSGTDAS